jgi:ABC-2 type transport system permease protein
MSTTAVPPVVTPPGPQPALREVKGPSAYGGSAQRFLNLTWMIAVTDFRVTYFGSALGYLWSLMRPLMSFAVMFLVFSRALKLGNTIRDYPVLLLFNIVLITFFQEATGNSLTSVINREALVRKMHFPRMVIPLATVLTSAFNFVLNLVAVFVFLLAYGVEPTWSWLALPLLITLFIALICGVAMLLSSLYVRYRDVSQIWGVLAQILFYGSLVFFTIERVHSQTLRRLVLANPIAATLQQGRHWIIDPHAPSVASAMGGGVWWLLPLGIGTLIVVGGLIVFDRQAPRIAELL